MGDLHVVIVDDIGKVVSGEAVTLHDDKVLLGILIPEAAVDDVLDEESLLAALEANGVRVTPVCAVIGLLKRDVATCAGVGRERGGLVGLAFVVFQFFSGAEASVRLALPHELVGVLLVKRKSFGLG